MHGTRRSEYELGEQAGSKFDRPARGCHSSKASCGVRPQRQGVLSSFQYQTNDICHPDSRLSPSSSEGNDEERGGAKRAHTYTYKACAGTNKRTNERRSKEERRKKPREIFGSYVGGGVRPEV